MGILATLARRETRALTTSEWLLRALGGPTTYTGRSVGPSDAMRMSAVYACVEVIADTIAALPCHVRRALPDGSTETAKSHRLYRLLHDSPNPEMTAAEYWQAAMGHRELWGNHYSEIEYDNAGRVVALWPLRPDRMNVTRNPDTREINYTYATTNDQVKIAGYRVLHLRGLSNDGVVGLSRIALAREAIGLGLATEEFAARFFGNDASPGGVLTHPGKLTPQGQKTLKESWESAHRGLTRAHRIAVLEEGVTWQAIGVPQKDAQFLETRAFQLEEIARIFRVPPHKIGILTRSTNNNIEHQGIEFVNDTIYPRLVSIQQRLNLALLSAAHQGDHYVEFVIDQLLRGDALTRAQRNAVLRQNGVINADEWRRFEGLNPLPDGLGQAYIVQVNMQDLKNLGAAPMADPAPPPDMPMDASDDGAVAAAA